MKKTKIILTITLLTFLLLPAFSNLQAVLVDPGLVADTAAGAGYDEAKNYDKGENADNEGPDRECKE